MMTLLACLLSLLQFLTGSGDVTLLFAGDAMQHDRQIATAESEDGYDYSACFRHVAGYIGEADYAVVNLECSLGGKPYRGYPCFSAPDDFARSLREAGFDLFLHANNHCLDRRDAGLVRTLDVLDSMGIPHVGTYRSEAERRDVSPFIATVKGIRIAFLNYTYGTNGITVQKDVAVNYTDKERISQEVAAARLAGADLIVACMHWGEEYKLVQNRNQESLADFLVCEGVDLIVGGHPHVVQPMEIRRNEKTGKDVLIVYSLGNFISGMRTQDTRGGALVKVVVGREGGQTVLKGANYKLVFTQQPSGSGGNYELIPSDKPELVRQEEKARFEAFLQRARSIFDCYNERVPEDNPVPLKPIRLLLEEDEKTCRKNSRKICPIRKMHLSLHSEKPKW